MTVSTPACTTQWGVLAQELEALYELTVSQPNEHRQAIASQLTKVEETSASLRALFTGLDRRNVVAASLYDQVDALLTYSLSVGAQPHGLPFMSASVRDLAARVMYADRYPSMVQHTMLCESIDSTDWPHHEGVHTDPRIVATQLSLAAAVAQHRGEAAHLWVGYTLTEEHRREIGVVAGVYPVLEQCPDWFGTNLPTRRWALTAVGVFDDLDETVTETALGLLDGWESNVCELLDVARRLND